MIFEMYNFTNIMDFNWSINRGILLHLNKYCDILQHIDLYKVLYFPTFPPILPPKGQTLSLLFHSSLSLSVLLYLKLRLFPW